MKIGRIRRFATALTAVVIAWLLGAAPTFAQALAGEPAASGDDFVAVAIGIIVVLVIAAVWIAVRSVQEKKRVQELMSEIDEGSGS